jgi:hypothetical protein
MATLILNLRYLLAKGLTVVSVNENARLYENTLASLGETLNLFGGFYDKRELLKKRKPRRKEEVKIF